MPINPAWNNFLRASHQRVAFLKCEWLHDNSLDANPPASTHNVRENPICTMKRQGAGIEARDRPRTQSTRASSPECGVCPRLMTIGIIDRTLRHRQCADAH